jgi:threonylcarbamoyladenosine tRNA methylthiotransferase MtaB
VSAALQEPRAGGLEVITFGCRLNAHESDLARAAAGAAGLEDGVIFNTCAVTAEAVRQARQAIRRARRERPEARLVVTGCAAQIEPDAFAAMPEVDLVLGNGLKSQSASYGADAFSQRVRVTDLMTPAPASPASLPAPAPPLPGGRTRAFVEVQNGCDHRCTFCIIPFGRGAARSTPPEQVVQKVRARVEEGALEVVMTGVDLTSWGQDLPGRPALGALTRRILREVRGLKRLRLSSIDAAEIDPELLEALRVESRLMPHLHLSLQAGDDMILKRMKRRHGRDDALRLVEAVRRARPDTAFGADLIAGFPTETEAMFQNTLSLIGEAGLAYVHVFPFSPRPGAPAARMPQLPREVVRARALALREAAAAALRAHLAGKVGRTLEGLVETDGRARAEDFTEIQFTGEAPAGTLRSLRVHDQDGRRALAALAA